MNSAAMSMGAQLSPQHIDFSSSGYMSGSGIAGSHGGSTLHFYHFSFCACFWIQCNFPYVHIACTDEVQQPISNPSLICPPHARF
jgi:hypothetical protein